MTAEVVRVKDDSPETDLREAITNLSHRAQREFPRVGNDLLATPWDVRHAAINDLLDLLDWERSDG